MSARRDLLSPGLIEELKRLRDEVPPIPFAEVLPYVIEECPALATCMHSIDPVPLAASPRRFTAPCWPTAHGSN